MDTLRTLNSYFWSEKFWLPSNNTWADLERTETTFTPQGTDLWILAPLSVLLFAIRLLWERFLALPAGRYYNIKESPPRKAAKNDILDAAFKKSKFVPNEATLQELSKKTDLTVRQIERWWRRRRTQNKPSEMQRFKETSWRCFFYTSAFWYGVYVLYDKPWFWDTKHCWYGYPRQHVDVEIYWYYMIELSFYWSLILSLFMDTKRKDFVEMMVHHAVTIFLMLFSWVDNMVRIGSLVLLVHDAVDPLMEFAKLCKYAGYDKLPDAIFLLFTVTWFVTRLCIYPFRVVYSGFFESWEILGPFQSCYLFNGLLMTLQVLHVLWFCTILKMLYAYIVKGQVNKDERSETEPEDTDEDERASLTQPGQGDVTINNNSATGKAAQNGGLK